MTLLALIIHALVSSTAVSDSGRMAHQFTEPTIQLASINPVASYTITATATISSTTATVSESTPTWKDSKPSEWENL